MGDLQTFDSLKKQIEANMYMDALKEAQKTSNNAGASFDSNKFNAQWENQAADRKQQVLQKATAMIEGYK